MKWVLFGMWAVLGLSISEKKGDLVRCGQNIANCQEDTACVSVMDICEK
jgi:hypothetical protein